MTKDAKKPNKPSEEEKQIQRKKRRLIANFDLSKQQQIREANRIAARVCRKRKKQFAKDLESTLNVLNAENQTLTAQFQSLSSFVAQVKLHIAATKGGNPNISVASTTTASSATSGIARPQDSILGGGSNNFVDL